MPASKRQLEAMEAYKGLMEEAKVRLAAVEAVCAGRLKEHLPPVIAAESAYLQLRMLCELIALGCLVAHGDIEATQTNKFRKEYSADRIVSMLEKIHPAFYPAPIRLVSDEPVAPDSTNRRRHFEGIHSGYLTRAELKALWAKCGDLLHRGKISNFTYREESLPDFAQIHAWGKQIVVLLNIHLFALIDQKSLFVCALRNPDDNYRVQVSFAEAQEF